jgi:hypothetical protein
MPLAALDPPRVRINDRCNDPQDPNPLTDQPTGVYSLSMQSSSELIGQIRMEPK